MITGLFPSRAQVKNYDTQWKQVDELLEKKNLPKSALLQVKKIYEQTGRRPRSSRPWSI